MIRKQYDICERPGMRGGEGTVTIKGWLTDEEKPENLRLAATLVLPCGASIGNHGHDGEAEIFHIQAGVGEYNDDGTTYPVKAGDVLTCYSGHQHGIKNTGDADLLVNAIIITGITG